MGILFLIIVGAAAGFIATRMMGMDLPVPQTIAVGVIGALVGSFLLRLVLSMMGAAAGFIGAILGALLLLWAYKAFIQKH